MTSWPGGASSEPRPADPGDRARSDASRQAPPVPDADLRSQPLDPPPGHSADSVARRIGGLTASVLVLLVLVSAAASVALLLSSATVRKLSTGYAPAADANATALVYMLDAETGLRGFALTGQPSYLAPYRESVREVLPTIGRVTGALHDVGEHGMDAAIAAERSAAQRWLSAVSNAATRRPAVVRHAVVRPAAKQEFDRFRAANANVSTAIDALRATYRNQSVTERNFVLPFILAVAVLLILAVLFAVRTTRGVARPLQAVWTSLRRLEGGDLSARADETRGPAEVRELAAAVNNLAVERRRALAARRADDELRREVRGVTSAIRLGHDAAAMARTLVAGLGRSYDVDRVWLQTFDGQRVTEVSEQWRRGKPIPEIVPSATESDELRWLANRLWHTGSPVAINDHSAPPADLDPELLRAPQSRGAQSSIVAAVGEGAKAIGLLWVSTVYEQRTWTSAELGLMQHVAAELAQHLVQNHVLRQQQEAMRRLREADEAKTALVSTVSHELRTPLTSIIGYLDVLLDMDDGDMPPEVAGMLHVIERNAHRLRALIEDLLTQSQIEAGRRLVELSRVDLVDVLAEVEDTIEPLADNAHLGFAMHLPARGVLIVDGDPRQLGQAVTNLVANAVKFTPRGGRVTVSANLEADADGVRQAVIRVADTGIGIPAEEVPHLFDRFFRATNARKAVIQGTGLGLAIVAEIVAQHTGTVDVLSELGIGTTIAIRLPLAGQARPVPVASNVPVRAAAGTVEAAADPARES